MFRAKADADHSCGEAAEPGELLGELEQKRRGNHFRRIKDALKQMLVQEDLQALRQSRGTFAP